MSAPHPLTAQAYVTAAQAVWNPGRHISHLDGVRGLAILIVTLYRFSRDFPEHGWLGQAIHSLLRLGETGVELFFVLSGFLITGILVDAKGKHRYFRNFFARRGLRIFPLYFSSLFVLLVLFPLLGMAPSQFEPAIDRQFYLWTYLTNVQMSIEGAWCFGPLDHFWSLAVEEHFYLVWPLVIFFLSPARAFRVTLALIAVVVLGRIGFAVTSSNGVAPDVLSIFRFDALLMGSALALIIRQPLGLAHVRKWLWVALPVLILVALAAMMKGGRLATVPLTIIPLIWSCVMIWLLTSNRSSILAKLLDTKFLKRLGKYSYAMYVFQSPLIPLTAGVLSIAGLTQMLGTPILAGIAYIVFMFVLTYGAAVLSWYVIESRMLKLKDRFAD